MVGFVLFLRRSLFVGSLGLALTLALSHALWLERLSVWLGNLEVHICIVDVEFRGDARVEREHPVSGVSLSLWSAISQEGAIFHLVIAFSASEAPASGYVDQFSCGLAGEAFCCSPEFVRLLWNFVFLRFQHLFSPAAHVPGLLRPHA